MNNKTNLFFKRVFTSLMVVILVFSLGAGMTPITVSASDDSWKQEQAKLEDERKKLLALANELAKKYSSSQSKIAEKKEYKNALESQIGNVEKQINNINNRIESIDKQLSEIDAKIFLKENEISKREAEIEGEFQKLRERLRAISKSGNASGLQMLMDTKDYADYLIKSKMMERIAENDQKLMEQLEEEIKQINKTKDELLAERKTAEAKKREVEELKKDQKSKANDLSKLYSNVQTVIGDLQSESEEYRLKKKKYEQEAEKVDNELQELLNKYDSNGSYSGTMYWPVPGYKYISSPYGMRSGGFHRGVDIAGSGIYGANIVAAASGTVIKANKTDSWGGTYGYHVILDNGVDSQGRKVATMYAHMSKVKVNVGDKVIGGKTVLGEVGSTGNSTGPHLHFEVRLNGSHTQPMPKYINK